mgnify:CR=1 FL=1
MLKFATIGLEEIECVLCMGSLICQYVHIVFATKGRMPLLTYDLLKPIFESIKTIVSEMGLSVVAINGVSDHVHILIRMDQNHLLSDVVRDIKRSTSALVRRNTEFPFKWQRHYAAFSVSANAVPCVIRYIHNQQQHHNEIDSLGELSHIANLAGEEVPFDLLE